VRPLSAGQLPAGAAVTGWDGPGPHGIPRSRAARLCVRGGDRAGGLCPCDRPRQLLSAARCTDREPGGAWPRAVGPRAAPGLAVGPASAVVRRWRALFRLRSGDVRGAQEDAELANRLQPGDMVMESVLATVLARAGDSARARALIGHWPGRTDHWLIMAALVA